ncbi:MAG: YitT family protein [Lachnospiraceae bacterium]|nr:YitT family protein [Lachnospiraceae bacterium]
MNLKAKEFAIQLFWEIIGSIFIAAGIYNFADQAEFPMTGFSGISIILYRFFQIPIGLSTILLNVPVAFLCYRLLGKNFFLSSIRCMIVSSIFIDYLAPLFPVYKGSRLLAALCTGIFGGIGYALIYTRNSSTGGSDFIIMAVKALKPHLSLGNISFLSDVGIILIGGILFRDVDGIIYGMIVNYLFAIVVDQVMYGINAGKVALIVTTHGKAVCDAIASTCNRGTTILPARGGYKEERRQVVLCACSTKEMYKVQQTAKETDPASFVIIMESNEVHGEGFRMTKVGEAR